MLSDGFFPYSKFNFELAQKKGLVAKPLFLKFFEGVGNFLLRKFLTASSASPASPASSRPARHAALLSYKILSHINGACNKDNKSFYDVLHI